MKNLTVSVDEETYKRARIVAAQKGTSVSALVSDYLTGLAAADERLADLKSKMAKLLSKKRRFAVGPKPSREETYAGCRGIR